MNQQASGRVNGIELIRMSVGPLQVNAYLLIAGDQAVVVDPGEEGQRISAELALRGARLRAIWLTHAHFDHVGGITDLLETAGRAETGGAGPVRVHMHPADQPLLEQAVAAAARWSIQITPPPTSTVDIQHGDVLEVAGIRATALHTPGHAPGHVAFHLPQQRLVLSGDALFQGSVGRTDLPLADPQQLKESIRRELMSLPDDTMVLPGHGPATTVGAERRDNPFL